MKMNTIGLLLAASTLTMPLVAFGGAGHGSHPHGGANGEPGKAGEVSRTIEVKMQDNYFDPEKIVVKAGETIRFVVENEGVLVHEFNIGTAEMHVAHQQEMRMMVEHGALKGDHIDHHMMEMDMGNGHTMKHDDPNSALLEPGKAADIVWKFGKAADLEFACNIPGHYESGMAGAFQLERTVSANQ